MTEEEDNNKLTSSKIISIQSTSDGDIQTVTEETTVEQQSNNLQISPIRDESVRAFKNHLRDSWDEVADVPSRTTTTTAGDDNNNGKEGTTSGVEEEGTKQKKKTRHKQNLSVQFLDFNISEDSNVTNFTLSGINNNDAIVGSSSERRKKETITGSFRFGEEASQASSTTTTTKVEHNKDTTASATTTLSQSQNDMTNFTNNLQNSWNETTSEDIKDNKASFVSVKQQVSNHKPNNQSVQFLDSTVMEYSNDMPVTNNKQSNATTNYEKDISSQISSRESVQQQQKQQQPSSERERLGSDSPISPYSSEKNDIVVPIPLRSNAPNSSNVGGGGGVNRKHRRVFSGRSNPAMSHRRVNTRGDKHAPAREFKFDGGLVGSDEGEQQQQQQKKAFNAPNSEQLLSPASQAMPPPIPPQQIVMGQPQGGPQHYPPPPPMAPPHPSYYHGTPPPSYDPYNVYGQHPPGVSYYNASPQSDAGVNYNTNRASPVVSTAGQQAPLAQGYPSQQHQQQAFHNSNTPLSTQSAPDGCYTFTEKDVSMSSSNSQPPNLEQPLLDNNNNTSSHQKSELKIHTDEKLFGNSSTNDQGSKQQHRKDPSLNPLPFNDNGHHRKQSSLGSFLATAELFDDGTNNNDDSGIYYEKEGYASAPEEGDSNKRTHNKTLSSASFMRSLSSDDFLRQMNDEEAKESSAAVKIPQQQQQQRPQQQVPPQHPHPSYPPPMHSSSPVMSYPPQAFHHPPTPPGSMPRYPTPPGSLTGYPTPPGSVTGYPTPPGSHAGTPPNYYAYGPPPPYGTPPQSMMWQQHQYPPPQDQRASPNLPMHYSPDPQASMQFQQPPQPYQQVPPPPHMPSRGPADIQSGPPLLQQSMICQPAPKGKQTDQQKRSRRNRKCTVPDCPNRVVQGGLCITHGAKRKICSHPGCTKNVKKLGLMQCSRTCS